MDYCGLSSKDERLPLGSLIRYFHGNTVVFTVPN